MQDGVKNRQDTGYFEVVQVQSQNQNKAKELQEDKNKSAQEVKSGEYLQLCI